MVCLLSSFLLLRTRYVRYLMAFWCIFFMNDLILDLGSLSLSSCSIECSWMAPRTLAVIVMRGWFSIRSFVCC